MNRPTLNQNSKLSKTALAGLLFALPLFTSLTAPAQTQSSSTIIESDSAPEKNFGLIATLAYTSNMYKTNQHDHATSTTLELNPSLKLNPNWTASMKGSVTKEHTAQENTVLSNFLFRFTNKTAQLTPELLWTNRVDAIAPMNKDSKERDRMQGALALGTGLKYVNEALVIPVTLAGVVSFQRNFHEYNINAEGAVNNEYGISQSLVLELGLTKKVSLSFVGIYKTAFTYRGAQKYSFESGAEVGYEIIKNFSASLGLSNNGNALKPNGLDSNLSFLNEKTSEVSFGLGYTY